MYEGKDGTIEHAELSFGTGMIMVSSIRESEFGKHMKQPDEIGGAETQSLYLIVSDADVVYRRAKSGGAEMLIDIRDESYGGRGFTCRDPEGHIWSRAGALNVFIPGGFESNMPAIVAGFALSPQPRR